MSDPKTAKPGVRRPTDHVSRSEFNRRTIIVLGLTTLFVAVGAAFAQASDVFFLIFLSIVAAVMLRALADLLDDWDAIVGRLQQWSGDESAFAEAGDFAAADVRAPYRPGQVFCTGANYKKHVVGLIMGDPSMRTAEHEGLNDDERRARVEAMMDERAKAEPYCFIKLPSCVVGPRDAVVLPRGRREEVMARHAQDFASWLETVLARSPMAWFNFFPFWRQGEQPPVMSEQR